MRNFPGLDGARGEGKPEWITEESKKEDAQKPDMQPLRDRGAVSVRPVSKSRGLLTMAGRICQTRGVPSPNPNGILTMKAQLFSIVP